MQNAPYYATARDTLASAERTIVTLERELADAKHRIEAFENADTSQQPYENGWQDGRKDAWTAYNAQGTASQTNASHNESLSGPPAATKPSAYMLSNPKEPHLLPELYLSYDEAKVAGMRLYAASITPLYLHPSQPPSDVLPDKVFDGYSVWTELQNDPQACQRTSHENVQDVLNAIVRYRRGAQLPKDNVDAKLAEDCHLYGTSYARIDADGTRTRIDPATIMIEPQPDDLDYELATKGDAQAPREDSAHGE